MFEIICRLWNVAGLGNPTTLLLTTKPTERWREKGGKGGR